MAHGVLLIDDFFQYSIVIGKALARRGFNTFRAATPEEALTLFRAHRPQINLAVLDVVNPAPGNLDLAAELEQALPVLYLVGSRETIMRSSMETHSVGSVLRAPFTEALLVARVGGLMNIELAAGELLNIKSWKRLMAASNGMSPGTAMLHVYERQQAALAARHVALLRAGKVDYDLRGTSRDSLPYSLVVRARDLRRAQGLLGWPSADCHLNSAA